MKINNTAPFPPCKSYPRDTLPFLGKGSHGLRFHFSTSYHPSKPSCSKNSTSPSSLYFTKPSFLFPLLILISDVDNFPRITLSYHNVSMKQADQRAYITIPRNINRMFGVNEEKIDTKVCFEIKPTFKVGDHIRENV